MWRQVRSCAPPICAPLVLQSPLRRPLQKKAGRSGAASKDDTWVAASFILIDVRFTPESGHVQPTSRCPLCANSGLWYDERRLKIPYEAFRFLVLIGAAARVFLRRRASAASSRQRSAAFSNICFAISSRQCLAISSATRARCR